MQTTTDIGPWLASFLSEILARLHHMVMLSYSFCFREFWCKRLTRVVPACRAVRTAPDSALTSGGKTLLKKQKKNDVFVVPFFISLTRYRRRQTSHA